VNNACGQSFTYRIDGQETYYVGKGDLHDGDFDSLKQVYKINDVQQSASFAFREASIPLNKDHCPYVLTVYPSETLEDEYITYKPALYTSCVALAFVLISAVAITYDCVVQRRLKTVLDSALESRAIVSSLFPANVRDRLFENDGKVQKKERTFGESADDQNPDKDHVLASHPAKLRLKSFLHDGPASGAPDSYVLQTKPIADLFPHCTVLFADIAGFTAWSSEREPAQVFMLLQTIFHFFDNIARKWGVFKVETIGDCYVAVTGLPDPQPDHAIRMTKFARECLHKVTDLTHKLESTLGPDTGDLKMRFGLHSGPVTAGVLRGEKSRFQLFGDTVNTASRMEATGKKNFIQISQSTADQLVESGKESWITAREDLVSAKGKGQIQTYWVTSKTQRSASSSGTDPESETRSSNGPSSPGSPSKPSGPTKNVFELQPAQNRKLKRLVDWQTDMLAGLLKPVLAQRGNKPSKNIANPATVLTKGACVLDEVAETLVLPKFDAIAANANPNSIELSPTVLSQLRDFVTVMAKRYLDNPFHNFEHASHVTMSASKLLNRIVIPEDVNYQRKSPKAIASDLHDYTYGITSDPLTQFAVIFCALIHDVDHRGVSNFQLANEIPEMATKYKNRGLAEQNSVDISWDVLMEPQYKDLQNAIFSNEFELQRFRQLVVNLVMSTDIFDKDSKALRNSRWEKAFHSDPNALPLSEGETTNLKATIVIEHIIQAADVAHTMQHWHVYQKWNERLFQEMYVAFDQGRSASDPSAGWYKGELWFYDFYVIPLAKKLDECNVFGVASDEGLNYALANRAEWAIKGEELVAEMLERYKERRSAIVEEKPEAKLEPEAQS
jgi:class 3 adenylate cyclase